MRKLVVEKMHYRCLTPSLTEGRIKNFQQILQKHEINETKTLAEILSGEMRLKILYLLGVQSNLCVNDIADILKSKISGISHQLSILRKEGLVTTRKKQKVVYYSLSQRLPSFVSFTLKNCGV